MAMFTVPASHDKTGKHCPADDPNGKLDIVKCAGYWLKDAAERGIKHILLERYMFPTPRWKIQRPGTQSWIP